MPRAPAYTPEEDAIILRTSGQPVEATNQLLADGGFKQRTADAITGRRYYLKTSSGAASDGNASVAQLMQRREALRRAVAETTEALAEVETVLSQKLKAELADIDLS
jgi:hypothetical protein